MKKALVVNDTRPDNHFGCQAVMEALIVILGRIGIEPLHFHPVGQPWLDDAEFYTKASQADLVIVNGEGSIHHSNARAQSLARLGPFCRHTLKVPGILLNATLAKNGARIYEDLQDYAMIQVRDHASIEEAGGFGLQGLLYAPDLSLFHDFRALRQPPSGGAPLRVGVSDSIVLAAREALIEFRRANGHVSASIGFGRAARPTIYDHARLVGGLDLLVTGRFHSVCYALNTGTPMLAVESNTPKITSLLMDVFGEARRVITPDMLPKTDLQAFAQWTEEERIALEAFNRKRFGLYDALSERIAALAGHPQDPTP